MSTFLFLTQLVTGLMAGVYLCWAISVLPGLRRLQDIPLLHAFQAFNRAILNPPFITLFVASAGLTPLMTATMYLQNSPAPTQLLVFASLLLILGHAAVTILGNIPINNTLDQLDINFADQLALTKMRKQLETRWRYLHWLRTLATCLAFGLLLLVKTAH